MKRRTPENILLKVSLSLRMTEERRMVTMGLAKMMQRASGTGIMMTEAREEMKVVAAMTPWPTRNSFCSTSPLDEW